MDAGADIVTSLAAATGGTSGVLYLAWQYLKNTFAKEAEQAKLAQRVEELEKQNVAQKAEIVAIKTERDTCKARCEDTMKTQQIELTDFKLEMMKVLMDIKVSLARIEAKEDVLVKLKSLLQEGST